MGDCVMAKTQHLVPVGARIGLQGDRENKSGGTIKTVDEGNRMVP